MLDCFQRRRCRAIKRLLRYKRHFRDVGDGTAHLLRVMPYDNDNLFTPYLNEVLHYSAHDGRIGNRQRAFLSEFAIGPHLLA